MTTNQHNDIVVLMIPEFVDVGGPWKVLPFGIHKSSFEEIEQRFAINEKRRKLFKGLVNAAKALKKAGCITIYLDGSFVTDKENPTDYDVCWNPLHVDVSKLDPVFLNYEKKRAEQKSRYYGEFFLTTALADGSRTFIEYFQIDKETGNNKGIISINL